MGVTVMAPPPMVLLPGREPMPLFPALRPPAEASRTTPAPYRPPPPAQPTEPPQARWRVTHLEPQVEVPGLRTMPLSGMPAPAAAPPPTYTTSFATSVALVPAGGTNVTSTPANLMIGPLTYISDFTIVSLDAGIY